MRHRAVIIGLVVLALVPVRAGAASKTYKPPYYAAFGFKECIGANHPLYGTSACTNKISGSAKTGRMKLDSKFVSPSGGLAPTRGLAIGAQFIVGAAYVDRSSKVPVSVSFKVTSAKAETSIPPDLATAFPQTYAVAIAIAGVGATITHTGCPRCTGEGFAAVAFPSSSTVKNRTVTVRFSIKNASGAVPSGIVVVSMWGITFGSVGYSAVLPVAIADVPAPGWARAQMDVTATSFKLG